MSHMLHELQHPGDLPPTPSSFERAGLDPLVDAIYAAAVDPSSWRHFLRRFTTRINSRAAVIPLRLDPPKCDLWQLLFHNVRPDYLLAYFEHFVEIDPVLSGANMLRPGSVFRLREFFSSEGALRESEIYRRWFEPQGFSDLIGVTILPGSPFKPMLIAMTCQAQSPFRPDAVDVLTRLTPHLQRAVALHQSLVESVTEAELLAHALDVLPSPTFVIDARGRVEFCNEAGRTMLERSGGLTMFRGVLGAETGEESARLRNAVREAIARHRPDAQEVCLSVSRRGGAERLSLTIAPLRTPLTAHRCSGPAALVIAHDRAHPLAISPDHLRSLFGLTRAQAELAAMVAEGLSLESIAKARGLSIHTVRDRLKQVFARTDTRSQPQLVQRLLSSPVVLGSGPAAVSGGLESAPASGITSGRRCGPSGAR